MKKVIVFGASGGCGLEIVKHALDKGLRVTAVVRNPAAFTLMHPALTVVKGDVMKLESFSDAMKGQDAVISALGSSGRKPTILYSMGARHIMMAMHVHDVRRLLCVSASALYTNQKMSLFLKFFIKAVLQPLLKEPYNDMRLMEKEVQQSGLDYTIVRPPRLLDKRGKGTYRIAVNDHLTGLSTIARADVGHYMVQHLENKKTYGAIVEISD